MGVNGTSMLFVIRLLFSCLISGNTLFLARPAEVNATVCPLMLLKKVVLCTKGVTINSDFNGLIPPSLLLLILSFFIPLFLDFVSSNEDTSLI